MNEKKVFTEIQNSFNKLFEKISKKNVLISFINTLEKKEINIIKEGLEIIQNFMKDSSNINDYPLQEIINFCLNFYSNSNNIIKKSAFQLLSYIYKKIGNEIDVYFPNLSSMIKEELNKKEDKDNNFDSDKNEISNKIDISDKFNEKIIKDLKDGKWF